MSHEVTVPMLPCASIDDMLAFYEALGFHHTYKQRKPNPYLALRREDLHLHFFEMPGFDPEQSYSTCLVLTPDTGELHRAFAAGLRAAYGKVPVAGIPRMTRPRVRKNYDGLTGFSVIDPGGNWIRVVQHEANAGEPAAALKEAAVEAPAGRLTKAVANAVVQGDSKGDARQAARILDSALARAEPDDDPVSLMEALVYRAEVALVLHDPATATALLARAEGLTLDPAQRRRAAASFDTAADLRAALA